MLEIVKCNKDPGHISSQYHTQIRSRQSTDLDRPEEGAEAQDPGPDLRSDEDLYVASFDGSARVKRGGGAYSAIMWKLPERTVVKARSGYAEGLTVNEAEYNGLLLRFDLLEGTDPLRLVICGDSNLVIRQVRGEIDCKAPGLTLLRQKALDRLRIRPDHELSGYALQRQCGIEVETDSEIQDLITLNRLDEILVVKSEDPVMQISSVTTRSKARSGVRSGSNPPVMCEEVIRELRIERIRQAQDEEAWIHNLK
ncbi:reverse transcriptase [Phytophthora megakarya]|uniref:Reverse transcriptase n=1 Tax=Phytophthora megakarya TaxID=4795 RepID=A0A225UH84_9STRA|nr:reverse transcriptase [Phytophthora megakarya]